MAREIAALGVDLGGSWVRVQGVDAIGNPIFLTKKPSVFPRDLSAVLSAVLRQKRLKRLPALGVASRGIWFPEERRALARSLSKLAARVYVVSDVEGAWFASFGTEPNAAGILVAAGTGSIALARDVHGKSQRAGGLGPYIGDEGSAFWIGREWLRRTVGSESTQRFLKRLRGHAQQVREIAQYSDVVQRALRAGNRAARQLIDEAQAHLAALVRTLAVKLAWEREVPVGWAGGMFDDTAFRAGWMRLVENLNVQKDWRWQSPLHDTATAMALLALRKGRPPRPPFRAPR